MLTKEHKLHWDVAKWRFAWESREQHPSCAWCVPQQTPALLAVWSIVTMGGAGTIWPVLLPSLAEGGLGVMAGAAGRPRAAALHALAGSARELAWKSHQCLYAGKGVNHNKGENWVMVLCKS